MDNLETSKVLEKHHHLIQEIYNKKELKCLRGEREDDHRLAGRSVYEWYFNTCDKIRDRDETFEYQFVIDNLLFYSDEIMFFTANLILVQPFLTDPEFGKLELEGKEIYPYDSNLADKRFNMYTEIIIEKLYSYWSQISLILKGYFIPQLSQYRVNFASVINELEKNKIESENFNWLLKFKKGEYSILNKKRKEIVHTASADTTYRKAFFKNISNPDELRKYIEERQNLPSYFKKHILYSISGFEKTLNLINEISV